LLDRCEHGSYAHILPDIASLSDRSAANGELWRDWSTDDLELEKPMRINLRLVALGALILALNAMAVGNAQADTVRIDDLLDGVPVVTADNPAQLVILAATAEFVHFTFTEPVAAGVTTTDYKDFLETDNSVSDRIIFTATAGSNVLDVQFSSDPLLLPIPPNGFNLGPVLEDGTFQLAVTYSNITAPDTNYFVRSDVAETGGDLPEPSSLSLLGLGGLALAAASWRKRRAARLA
jgi:PEP-CTERM motif